jgi:anti-sigma regulatory factor (Ser/Thr protein kinase)
VGSTGVWPTGEVRLVVPAKPEYIGLARVTAAGLASRLGFSYDGVEDFRLAIDEACFSVTGATGKEGTLELRFLLGPEGITVHGQGFLRPDASPSPALSELSERMLDALVDEHSLDGAPGPHFTLVKRLRQGPAGLRGAGG